LAFISVHAHFLDVRFTVSSPRTRAVALAACACFAVMAFAADATAETLRVAGTGSATELLKRLGAVFKTQSGIEVEALPSLGSSGAINALADGVLDLAVSGRALKPQESAQGLSVAFTARTPFVLATSHPSPNGMTLAAIADAFQSERAAWSNGSPIRVILRPRSETDTTLLGELFPGVAAAMEKARRRPDIPVAATDQDNADMAEQTPGSLVGSTLTQIRLEKRNLRLVPIEGVEPTFENFERGIYRHAKPLHFVAPARPAPLVERFIAFLRSPEGQRARREAYAS
jgi:phosphate transport system substrate-binding protein